MKVHTKEDIKMGSIWRDKKYPLVRAEITRMTKTIVFYLFSHPDDYKKDEDRNELYRNIDSFLEIYEPVYIIEGFEV